MTQIKPLRRQDGAFELLQHSRLTGGGPEGGALYAVVRSLGTGRTHMLVEFEHGWGPIRDDAFAATARASRVR